MYQNYKHYHTHILYVDIWYSITEGGKITKLGNELEDYGRKK